MPLVDVARIKGQDEVKVLGESPRSLLVEAPADELHELIEHMPGWIMAQEQMWALPDQRPRAKAPAPTSPATRARSPRSVGVRSSRRPRTKPND